MTTVLAGSGTIPTTRRDDISAGEVRTSNGLALSPTMAAMCADDFVRTIEFIRGTHAAIVDVRERFPDRPARVLYAGCGPYATLAVPLLAIFSSARVAFTLLDVQPASIESAESIVDALGLVDRVADFETMDAASYRVCPDQPPDVILIEMMRACLASEPQVAITRHLVQQAPNAILIPEEVRLDLTLAGPVQHDRIDVASVFVVNRETVDSWNGNCSTRLPASAVRIPDSVELRYRPELSTRIRVFQHHILKDGDSGLTLPRPLPVKGPVKPGDIVQFCYELGSHPRLHGEVSAPLG